MAFAYGSGVTHWVSYAPENMGKDWVTAACGQLIRIEEFSAKPTCQSPLCKRAALVHLTKLLLERQRCRR